MDITNNLDTSYYEIREGKQPTGRTPRDEHIFALHQHHFVRKPVPSSKNPPEMADCTELLE
jgi:hypothetical protein